MAAHPSYRIAGNVSTLFVGGPMDGQVKALEEPLAPTYHVAEYVSEPITYASILSPIERSVGLHPYQLDRVKVPSGDGLDIYEFYRSHTCPQATFDYSSVDISKCHKLGNLPILPPTVPMSSNESMYRLPGTGPLPVGSWTLRSAAIPASFPRSRFEPPDDIDYSAIEMRTRQQLEARIMNPNSVFHHWDSVPTPKSEQNDETYGWWGTALTIIKE